MSLLAAAAAPGPSVARAATATMAPPGPPAAARAVPLPEGPPAARAAEPTQCTPKPGTRSIAEPWAQRRLSLRDVWRLTKGAGVTVAVVDSGLDITHPQLKGAAVYDVTGSDTGTRDCDGHGTAVAGILAGRQRKESPFSGVAPQARLISVKHTVTSKGDVGNLARAIARAADLGADVINVSVRASDHPDLRTAVTYAQAKGAVIVAAAGNSEDNDSTPAYPATYTGVLSVGAAGPDGRRTDFSNTGSPVSVLAPGEGVTSTWPWVTYREDLRGTSFAAPYVAGVVALVRAYHPELSAEATVRRITLTADGGTGAGVGAGMVNPLLAVTAVLPSEAVALAPPPPVPLPPDAIRRAPAKDVRSMSIAGWVALGSFAAAGAVVVAGIAIPAGRRRRWRAGALENGA
ncbi:type VII secretion-associated serine protease mycosin [Streptosporangium pseudovulgare]|uniref:type VII secretion-associated serine protease mycosin n=1 Tax=Streptosporangium pseudovulgare TaxID=35765 RepID=UPI0016714667|nr:type VII secretion-associated serine protease mycosin [Streptosporangium pseudovulgare]